MEPNAMSQAVNQQAMPQAANQSLMQQAGVNSHWMNQLGGNAMMQSSNPPMMSQAASNMPMMTQAASNMPMMTQAASNMPMMTQAAANMPMMTQTAANAPLMQSMANAAPFMMQTAETPPIQPMKSAGEAKGWCEKHKYRYVLAQTHDGQCFDGFIEHIDDEVVCLAVPCCNSPWDNRGFVPFGGPFFGPFPRRRFVRRVFPLTALVGLTLLPFLFF